MSGGPSTNTRQATYQKKVRRFLRNPFFMLFATVMGLLAAIVPITGTPWADDGASDVSDFVIEGYGIGEPRVGIWALPFNVPLDEFPRGDHDASCSRDVWDWLQKVGRPRMPDFAFGMRNRSDTGGMLSVTNIKAAGDPKEATEPVFYVDCPNAGSGDVSTVLLSTDAPGVSAPAVDPSTGNKTPFAFNLAPGETGHVQVILDGVKEFDGKVTLEVRAGGGEPRIVEVPIDGQETHLVRAGFRSESALFIFPEKEPDDPSVPFVCTKAGGSDVPCSAAGARARLARLWDRPDLVAPEVRSGINAQSCDPGGISTHLSQWGGYFGQDLNPSVEHYASVVRDPFQQVVNVCGRDRAAGVLANALSGTSAMLDVQRDLLGPGSYYTGAPTSGDAGDQFFSTPSRNIACQLSKGSVRCDIAGFDWELPEAPDNCSQGTFGQSFTVAFAEAALACPEELLDPAHFEILAYDQERRVGSFHCSSARTGVTCRNADTDSGFTISRTDYHLF